MRLMFFYVHVIINFYLIYPFWDNISVCILYKNPVKIKSFANNLSYFTSAILIGQISCEQKIQHILFSCGFDLKRLAYQNKRLFLKCILCTRPQDT